ncbi:hypothetical protein [Chishuiella changwenlii]|uniref:hypothetical protein n=1 Tax=Chishuiella changwenlii TaxID=1434701 RepID=UPI002FDB27F4
MKKLNIHDLLPLLYTFYNKKLYDSQDYDRYTDEQEYFKKYTSKFYYQNFEVWEKVMERIAKETNTKYWETTHYNRQSFSCYFFINDGKRVLVMVSCLYNIFYIDDETTSNHPLVNLLEIEVNKLFPDYSKVNEEELMYDIRPFFEYLKGSDYLHTLHTALFGYKPTI